MNYENSITLPAWVVVIGSFLALLSIYRFIMSPSVRWIFRWRINKAIDTINKNLNVKLSRFAMTKRDTIVDMLVNDNDINDFIDDLIKDNDAPREKYIKDVRRYAKEIIPKFSAFFYYKIAYIMARWFLKFLYKVQIVFISDKLHQQLDEDVSVIMLMNHRSNMDFLINTYLTYNRNMMSYASGEWANQWPFNHILRLAGSYIVRRNSGNKLYRKVLERYAQMALKAGLPQGLFPEGGLSRDGRLKEPRIGLLYYYLNSYNPNTDKDVLLVPAATNYDRTPEDETLLRNQETGFKNKKAIYSLITVVQFLGKFIWYLIINRRFAYGYAGANFGEPISFKKWLEKNNIDYANKTKEEKKNIIINLASDVLLDIKSIIPVLPVSIVSTVFSELKEDESMTLDTMIKNSLELYIKLNDNNAKIIVPSQGHQIIQEQGLRILMARKVVFETNTDVFRINNKRKNLLDYYANTIEHLI